MNRGLRMKIASGRPPKTPKTQEPENNEWDEDDWEDWFMSTIHNEGRD